MSMSAADKIRALKEQAAKAATTKSDVKPITPQPTTVKEEKAKEQCEFCGNEFTNVASHVKKCKDNPVNATKVVPIAPVAPAIDIKSLFDEMKKYVVTPDQLMLVLKEESDRAKVDRDRLDTFIREHQTPTPTTVDMNGVPEAIKDLVMIIKEQATKPIEAKSSDEMLIALKSLNTELQRKDDMIHNKEHEMQILAGTVETLKRGVTREMPPELAVLITSVSSSWMDLLKPIEQRWKESTGYMKVIERLKRDIQALMAFVTVVPTKRDERKDVANIHMNI